MFSATASRNRSWFPSTICAAEPSCLMYRRTSSEFGPRFTRSPTNHNRSAAGSKLNAIDELIQLRGATLHIADGIGGHG